MANDNELDPVLSTEEKEFFESGGDKVAEVFNPFVEPAQEVVEPPPEQPAERRPPQQVPLPVLLEERERRKQSEERVRAYEAELTQRRDWQARIEERVRMAEEQKKWLEDSQNKAKIPDQNEDPLGYERAKREELERELRAKVAQLDQYAQKQSEWQNQVSQQANVQAQTQSILQNVQAQASAFASQVPDYVDAVRFMQTTRDRELALMGYQDAGVRSGIIQNEAAMLIDQSLKNGQNPAENLYKLAKDRGFGPTAPATQAPYSGQERIQNLQRGIQASRSLSSIPAVSGSSGLTLERLVSMPQEEFDRLHSSNPAVIDAIMREMN